MSTTFEKNKRADGAMSGSRSFEDRLTDGLEYHYPYADLSCAAREKKASSKLLSVEDTRHLLRDPEEEIRLAVLRNPLVDVSFLDAYSEAGAFSRVYRKAVADNPSTPLWILRKLALDDYHRVRMAIADHQNADESLLVELAGDGNADVRSRVAQSPHATSSVFIAICLASSENQKPRHIMAQRPDLPEEIIEILLTDGRSDLLTISLIARRPELAAEHAALLMVFPPEMTKEALPVLALNRHLEERVYYHLADLGDERVDLSLCMNPSTPEELLFALLDDADEEERLALALNPRSSSRILARLVRDEFAHIRAVAAGSLNLDSASLDHLTLDESDEVAAALAASPSLHEKALLSLVKRSMKIATVALSNEAVTELVVREAFELYKRVASQKFLLAAASCKKSSADILRELATFDEIEVLEAVAENENSPADLLASLSLGPPPRVREAVARNSSTNDETLVRLSKKDRSEAVKKAALSALAKRRFERTGERGRGRPRKSWS